jgi:phenylacetate-CoA ligase
VPRTPNTAPSAAARPAPGIESLSRDALTALQLQRLRETLRNAWDHVPWQRGGCAPPACIPRRGLADDLQRLPFTVKTDLRDHYPFGLFARPVPATGALHASSGTTGKAHRGGLHRPVTSSNWADLMARSLYCAGARPGDLVHNAYGYGLFTGGLGAHDGATRLGCPVVPMSGGATERQVALIMDFRPRVLCATPSYALAIAEVAEQQGVDLRHSGAARRPVRRRALERGPARARSRPASGLRAVDIYGLSEIMGPGVACECEAAAACTAGRTTSCSR